MVGGLIPPPYCVGLCVLEVIFRYFCVNSLSNFLDWKVIRLYWKMGAKQSKRSVDISGKEAEGGGEVAVAGAGGEGRVEQIADLDALKPQLNGDAHIQNEQSDKEKELDVGTPENEKDATTEKEEKEGSDKEKEEAPTTNGDAEDKTENGESTPPVDDGKKPKKEKVKKKWSLRSISFSRKDKPKQEKKQKEEEPKTNGEPEKVPEEAAETNPEPAANEVAEEAKAVAVAKEEPSPSTPVTEPLTNGSSTPEEATSAAPVPEPAPALTHAPLDADKPEVKPDPEPEKLPVNGLSLQDSKPEPVEPEKTDESKPEAPVVETVETAPAPEIPVKEVCVEQMPLLEPTPPPLPANPPPSSVVSFAATTMAPELTDASLPNTADTALALPDLSTTTNLPDSHVLANDVSSTFKTNEEVESKPQAIEKGPIASGPVDVPKDTVEAIASQTNITSENETNVAAIAEQVDESISKPDDATPELVESKPEVVDVSPVLIESKLEPADITPELIEPKPEPVESEPEKVETIPQEVVEAIPEQVVTVDIIETKVESVATDGALGTKSKDETVNEINESEPELIDIPPPEPESPSTTESPLPPPPPMQEDEEIADSLAFDDIKPIPEDILPESEANHIDGNIVNGINGISPDDSNNEDDKIVVKQDVTVAACNGDVSQEEADAAKGSAAPDTTQHTQEAITVSDKLADLIPEVPDVPELKTETLQETVSDVAVAN